MHKSYTERPRADFVLAFLELFEEHPKVGKDIFSDFFLL
jgi:hypothetical protein